MLVVLDFVFCLLCCCWRKNSRKNNSLNSPFTIFPPPPSLVKAPAFRPGSEEPRLKGTTTGPSIPGVPTQDRLTERQPAEANDGQWNTRLHLPSTSHHELGPMRPYGSSRVCNGRQLVCLQIASVGVDVLRGQREPLGERANPSTRLHRCCPRRCFVSRACLRSPHLSGGGERDVPRLKKDKETTMEIFRITVPFSRGVGIKRCQGTIIWRMSGTQRSAINWASCRPRSGKRQQPRVPSIIARKIEKRNQLKKQNHNHINTC